MTSRQADGPIQMTEDALKYRGEWVALSLDFQRVVGHGMRAKDAQEMAEEANEEHAILLFIPEEWPDAII